MRSAIVPALLILTLATACSKREATPPAASDTSTYSGAQPSTPAEMTPPSSAENPAAPTLTPSPDATTSPTPPVTQPETTHPESTTPPPK